MSKLDLLVGHGGTGGDDCGDGDSDDGDGELGPGPVLLGGRLPPGLAPGLLLPPMDQASPGSHGRRAQGARTGQSAITFILHTSSLQDLQVVFANNPISGILVVLGPELENLKMFA